MLVWARMGERGDSIFGLEGRRLDGLYRVGCARYGLCVGDETTHWRSVEVQLSPLSNGRLFPYVGPYSHGSRQLLSSY